MQELGTILSALGQGLRASSPHTTGEHILERVTIPYWFTAFPVGGSSLSQDHLHTLSILVGAFYLVPHPQFDPPAHDPDARVTYLIGHASRTGTEIRNRQLGMARATAVRAALESLGVPMDRLPVPESMGSLGHLPTAMVQSLEEMTLGAEMPEHRAVEMIVERTVSRPRLDTVDWATAIGDAPLSPSRARDFWYNYGGVASDITLGGASVALEILGMMLAGSAVTVVGALMVPVGAIMSLWQALDASAKRMRLYAMTYQATDWVMSPEFLVSRGPIPRPDQPERFWQHLDVPEPHASDGDRADAAARRQHWRDGADMMQDRLRDAVQAQYDLIVAQLTPARAAEAALGDVEQALRYAIRTNASGSPDRLANGREVLAHIYAELAEHAGLTGLRPLTYPSATLR